MKCQVMGFCGSMTIAKLLSDSKTDSFAGYTGMTIETVDIRFTAIGVYMASTICEHLQKWKGKPAAELLEEESGFHKELMEGNISPKCILLIFNNNSLKVFTWKFVPGRSQGLLLDLLFAMGLRGS